MYYDQNVVLSKKVPDSQEMETWKDLEVRYFIALENSERRGKSGKTDGIKQTPETKNHDKMWGN